MLFNKRGSFQKTTIYYCMLFNLCANWNETRGTVFNKKNTNLLQYAIQLVCVLKWNKRGSFQKKSNWWQYAAELVSEKKQEGQFSKNNNLLHAIQLVCVLKWNKRDSSTSVRIEMKKEGQFSKKNNLLHAMLLKWNNFLKKNTNLLQCYLTCELKWNKRDSFQQKKHKFITVCYSTCVRIEMKQEG